MDLFERSWFRPGRDLRGYATRLAEAKRIGDLEGARVTDSRALGFAASAGLEPTTEEVDRALAMIKADTERCARVEVDGDEFFAVWARTQGFGTAERAREAGFRLEPCSCCLPECSGWRVVR